MLLSDSPEAVRRPVQGLSPAHWSISLYTGYSDCVCVRTNLSRRSYATGKGAPAVTNSSTGSGSELIIVRALVGRSNACNTMDHSSFRLQTWHTHAPFSLVDPHQKHLTIPWFPFQGLRYNTKDCCINRANPSSFAGLQHKFLGLYLNIF